MRAREREPRKPLELEAVWREARELVWARKGRLLVGLALMLVSRLAGLVIPASSKWVIDDVIGKGQYELLWPIALAAGAATIIQAGTGFGIAQIIGVAAQRSITEMRRRVHERVMHLPLSYFESTKSGVLISRIMTDAEGIRNLVGTGLVQLVGGFVTALIALVVLFFLSWKLTILMIIGLIAFAFVASFAYKTIRPIFRERGAINAEVTGRLSEALGGIRVVKAYSAEKREEIEFTRGVHRLLRNIAKTIIGVSAVSAGTTLIFGLAAIGMMLLGTSSISRGAMTLGEFAMFILFTGMVARPVVQMASIGTQITEAFAGLDRIRDVLGEPTEIEHDETREHLESLRGDIEFKNVSFEYEEGKPVLRDISFVAPAGTTTALVGPSGSGKSTLIGLAMTFASPREGVVLVDGRDLSKIRLSDFRSHLGVVLQENFLFDGTILENIRYAKPNATFEEVVEVARIAHVDEFVEPLEDKYESIIGERGIKLSGGQRQRIAIARAILANPSILFLDEATSSLDSESESKIQDGLFRLRRGRTTFVIAHRLSTIRSADQILVLDDGRIVERGTHMELMTLGGRYRQLHDKQYNLEIDRFINPGEEWDDLDTREKAVVVTVSEVRPEDL